MNGQGGIVLRRLCRTTGPEARICGVCSGIARYFGVDPTLVRLITLLLIIPGGMSVWIYFIAALIMPKDCDC